MMELVVKMAICVLYIVGICTAKSIRNRLVVKSFAKMMKSFTELVRNW